MFCEHIFLVSALLVPFFSHVVPSVNAQTYLFNGGLIQSLLVWKHLYLEYISVNNGSRRELWGGGGGGGHRIVTMEELSSGEMLHKFRS